MWRLSTDQWKLKPRFECSGQGHFSAWASLIIADMERNLVTEEALESSAVIANCRMNRERGILGKNSYTADLFFNPLEFLGQRFSHNRSVAWLDLCCGTGKALIDAADHFRQKGVADRIMIQGVDLVMMFDPVPPKSTPLTLEAASLREWTASGETSTPLVALPPIRDLLPNQILKADLKRFGANFGSTESIRPRNRLWSEAGLRTLWAERCHSPDRDARPRDVHRWKRWLLPR